MRKNSRDFEFPLPFDPFRLLLAVLENLFWIILAALLLGLVGASFGWFRLGDSYKAPVRVLKESSPESWQDDPSGPYTPRPMSPEALKIIADSTEVFDLAAQKIGGSVTASDMRHRIQFEEIAGEDLFEAVGLSRSDPEDALDYAVAYVRALEELSMQRRREEAAAASELYAQHLKQKRSAISGVTKELLEASTAGGVFDTAGQTQSQLRELNELRGKRQQAFDALQSARADISVYLEQSWVGPLRAEVERLRRALGPNDSQVLARARELSEFEARLVSLASDDGDYTARAMAGKLPAVVYRQLTTLREQMKVAKLKLDGADARLAEADAGLKAMPDKVLAVSDLQQSLKEQLAASVLIETRMKDAEFYSKTPPPPLQVLQDPTLDDVEHRSAFFKASVLGLVFTFLGGLLMLSAVLVLEFFRRTVRTPLQAAIATSALPKLNFPQRRNAHAGNALRDFWLRSVGRHLPESRRFLFPVLGEVNGEEAFWSELFETLSDSPSRVVFMDFGRQQLAGGQGLPTYSHRVARNVSKIDPAAYTTAQLDGLCAELPEGYVLLVRWDRDPDQTLVELCRHMDRYYFITSGDDARCAEVEYLGAIYRDLLGEADGVILAEQRSPGRAKRIVAALEDWFIEARRSEPQPKPAGGGEL